MPELPEVQTVIDSLLAKDICGRKIVQVFSERKNTVGGDIATFGNAVVGHEIQSIRRRGKYIFVQMNPAGWIVIHLRMSGRLFLAPNHELPYVRAAVQLNDASWLCLYDPRRFARMEFFSDIKPLDARLGIEPLSDACTTEALQKVLQTGSTSPVAIKVRLLDQQRIAGIGNIYADEALFEAGIHPAFPASSLSTNEIDRLRQAIQTVLRRGLENLGTSLGDGRTNFSLPDGERGRNQEDIRVFRRTGLPCLRCGFRIERIRLGGRSTHFCPVCQQLGSSQTA